MKKRAVAAIVLWGPVLLCLAGCRAAHEARAPIAIDLRSQIPEGTDVTGIEVSGDRTRALVEGETAGSGSVAGERRCLILDLRKGTVTPLRDLVPGSKDAKGAIACGARLSPDGACLALDFGGADNTRVQVINLASGKTAAEFEKSGRWSIAWAGARLLLHGNDNSPVLAWDLKTKKLEALPWYGWVLGADATGSRLLAVVGADPTRKPEKGEETMQAVVTPEGRVLCRLDSGGTSCDRQEPVISRNGKYAAFIYLRGGNQDDESVSTRVVALDGGGVNDLHPWSYFMALTDRGEPICSHPSIRIGRKLWEALAPGTSAGAGTVVGDEFFYVDEGSRTFKSVALPGG